MIFQTILDPSLGTSFPTVDTVQAISAAQTALAVIGIPGTIFLGIIAFLFLLRAILHHQYEQRASFKQVVLQVTVPKERKEDTKNGGAPEQQTIQKIREDIAVMETLFANIGGLKPQHGIKAWLIGRDDQFSFEIVTRGGLIYFYVIVPKQLQNFIEEQVHAQFPSAVFEEIEDYNIFTPTGNILAGYFAFKRKNAFPIKTYKKLDSDPLSSITNSI